MEMFGDKCVAARMENRSMMLTSLDVESTLAVIGTGGPGWDPRVRDMSEVHDNPMYRDTRLV
eukprot:4847293-Pyramimonas_sp.AAC.1